MLTTSRYTSGLSSAPKLCSNEKTENSSASWSTIFWSSLLLFLTWVLTCMSWSTAVYFQGTEKKSESFYMGLTKVWNINFHIKPMSSIGWYRRPFAIKSVDVHKSPMAVKLIFNSVFCALYAPVTSMHLEKQSCVNTLIRKKQ